MVDIILICVYIYKKQNNEVKTVLLGIAIDQSMWILVFFYLKIKKINNWAKLMKE